MVIQGKKGTLFFIYLVPMPSPRYINSTLEIVINFRAGLQRAPTQAGVAPPRGFELVNAQPDSGVLYLNQFGHASLLGTSNKLLTDQLSSTVYSIGL